MNVRQIQITTGRRIMKVFCSRARGQSIIRGGAVAVAGFLQPLRFVSALIAQVKMAAHARKEKVLNSFRDGQRQDAAHEGLGFNRTPFNNVLKFLHLVRFVFT